VLHLLPSLDKEPVGVEGLRIYLLLNELLRAVQRHARHRTSTALAEAVAAAVAKLSADSLRVIGAVSKKLSMTTLCTFELKSMNVSMTFVLIGSGRSHHSRAGFRTPTGAWGLIGDLCPQ